jgi:Zn-dependent M16 (insulinase) family peptidase
MVAERCLANSTNAYTDQDHTSYSLQTGGSEGFLSLLPIYLDHLIFPTLTESAFVTEVHHVNEDGEDAGVVYSEMQDCENSCESLSGLAIRELLYPPGMVCYIYKIITLCKIFMHTSMTG